MNGLEHEVLNLKNNAVSDREPMNLLLKDRSDVIKGGGSENDPRQNPGEHQ